MTFSTPMIGGDGHCNREGLAYCWIFFVAFMAFIAFIAVIGFIAFMDLIGFIAVIAFIAFMDLIGFIAVIVFMAFVAFMAADSKNLSSLPIAGAGSIFPRILARSTLRRGRRI